MAGGRRAEGRGPRQPDDSRRVLSVEKHFCGGDASPGWAVCLEYLEGRASEGSAKTVGGKNGIDYREVLDPPIFALYAALRAWRKETAAKEGIPPYTILTNEQMASVAGKRCQSCGELETITGVGAGRVRKYGEQLLAVLRQAEPKETMRRAPSPVGATCL